MANQDIEIKLTAIDEASSVIDTASRKISADVDEVSNSQKQLSASVEGSLPPLAKDAKAQEIVGESAKKSDASMRSFTTGISGVATASFSLYGAYDRVNESEISLDRANLMVKSSSKGVEDAERALSKAVLEHGAGSDEASRASDSLSIAQDRLTLANERAQQAQENVNKSIMSAALQVIPTSITMVDSLSEAWNNFPDLTASFTKLKDKISDVGGGVEGLGTKLKGLNGISFAPLIGALSAVVVAAVDAKYSIDQTNYEKSVYKAEHGQNTEMPWYEQAYDYFKNFEIGAPMAISDYVISALGGSKPSVDQQAAINKFMKGEISKDELLEKFKNVPQLAKGGIIDRATFALIGEQTPEIVMPLSQYESQIRESSKTQADTPRQIITVDVGGLHFYGDIADSKFLEKAAEYTADKISDAVNLRR